MPFINLHVGKPLSAEKKAELAAAIAANVSLIPGKTVDNTMIEISEDCTMFMGGEQRELLFMDMRVYLPAPKEAKNALVKALTAEFEQRLGIPGNRQYYNIIELDGWGSRGDFH